MNTKTGTIEPEGDLATIKFQRELPYPPEAVWHAITDPAQRAQWFGVTNIDPRVGGRIEMTADGPPVPPEMRTIRGNILVWDPPRVFEHEWLQSIIGETVVRYELEATETGTRLTFTHRLISERNARGFTPGTHAFLDRLEALVAGEELPDWTARVAEVKGLYPGWKVG